MFLKIGVSSRLAKSMKNIDKRVSSLLLIEVKLFKWYLSGNRFKAFRQLFFKNSFDEAYSVEPRIFMQITRSAHVVQNSL